MTFSDGTTISLNRDDVVVFVGPNNAGKSRALRELSQVISNADTGPVLRHASINRLGTAADVSRYIADHSIADQKPKKLVYHGYQYAVTAAQIASMWRDRLGQLAPFFCHTILTARRIDASNPAEAIAFPNESPSHPIHSLYRDDALERRVSDLFDRAFGLRLFVYRLGGSRIPLLVGPEVQPKPEEDRLSTDYNARLLDSTVPLERQGDGMRSFASVILHILAPLTASIVLLDEPEAFLHPPQARLLGEIIATERRGTSQLFVATHSPDVVYGLLNVVENEHLRIIRLERVGDENRIKELDRAGASQIASDPLMKYSSVLSGVFHQRVIICESDADCMFYSTVLDLPIVRGPRHPDVLFIHASGKHRMAVQATALRSLGVPVDVIADMDIINDVSVIKGLFEALGGDWSLVEAQVKHVIAAIEERHPPMTAGDVARSIQDALHDMDHGGPFPKAARRTILDTLRDTSPWSFVKKSGEHGGIPSGTPQRGVPHGARSFRKCRIVAGTGGASLKASAATWVDTGPDGCKAWSSSTTWNSRPT